MRNPLFDNRYRILKKIGTGATGTVYKVKDTRNNSIIALKILQKKKISFESVQRFQREFTLLARLYHPNLCQVYDFGKLDDGRHYFTMEYVEGPDIIAFTKKSPYQKMYPIIVQLCRVLEYIHSKGLIHYDIKPGNILIAQGKRHHAQGVMPQAKLMDFGLAGENRIRGGMFIRGTFPYIAPEVIKGLAIDHRADLYSLGVLLYQIFTRKSFVSKFETSFTSLLEQQRKCISKPLSKIVVDIPRRLEQLIERLLIVEPAARYSRANEIIGEINKLSHSRFEFETEKTIEGYLLSSRFVGREKEMAFLQSSYEDAKQGKGKVVLITGDAGIGKSRLLKEFKLFAQLERSPCFTGYAHKDKLSPLEPYYDIFKELINHINGDYHLSKEIKFSLAILFKIFPDLADSHLIRDLPKIVPLEPEQEKLRSFEALSELVKYLAASLGYMIILLEDLHWADDLSIQFLEYLGRNLEDKKILICGTARKQEIKQNVVFQKAMTNLSSEGYFQKIELEPLHYRSLYSFLDSTITPQSNSSALVKYFMQKTNGNPFFVEEMMQTLLKKKRVSIGEQIGVKDFQGISLPKKIDDVVLGRIKDLDGASMIVVKFGAILLKDFNYDLMKRVTGLGDTELSMALWNLKRRKILIEKDNKYHYYHPTMREAVSERLRDKEKRELHYKVGKTLEQINKRKFDKVIEDLAYYFINAKDQKRGIEYGLQAAEKSSERYAYEQAIKFYKGVLKLLTHKEPKIRFNILRNLAQTEGIAGHYAEVIKHCKKALSLRIGAIDKKINVYFMVSDVYVRKGEYHKALRIYKRATSSLKKMKASRLKTLLAANINVKICRANLQIGNYKSASKFNLKLLKDLKGKETTRLLAMIYHIMGIIEAQKIQYNETDYGNDIFYYNKSYRYYKKIKDERNVAGILNNIGNCYAREYNSLKALSCYQKALQISEKIGDQYSVSINFLNLGKLLKSKGHYSKALHCYQRSLSISKKMGNLSVTGTLYLELGDLFLLLCNYKEAREFFNRALEIFYSLGLKKMKVASIKGIGNVYQALGYYTLALKFYKNALKISRDIKQQSAIANLFIDIGTIFIMIGEFTKAKSYIEKAMQIATPVEFVDIKIDCFEKLCRINVLLENYVAANDYYEKGLRTAKELRIRHRLPQFFLLLSEISYQQKEYSKGIKLANRVINLAEKMGTKDLYATALLMKVKNGIKHDILSKVELFKILDEAKKIAEEIGNPEILWKIYFEYGKYLQSDRAYLEALDYYQKCNRIFETVIGKMKNESYRKSYLSHPNRQEVDSAIHEIQSTLH